MKILHVIPSYYPALNAGGPITTSYQLNNSLIKKPNIEINVLTTDAGGPRSKPINILDLKPNFYLYPVIMEKSCTYIRGNISFGLLKKLSKLIIWSDIIHLNATFSFSTIPTLYYCRKWNKPLIWTLHGAILDDTQRDVFDPQPFYIKFLKSIWIKICNEFIDPKNMVIHVTSEQELNATKNKFSKATFILIPHGVELPNLDNQNKKWKLNNSLHILYIGRLAPVKGIENLLRAVKLINIPMNLYIYGSGNIDYENKLKKLTKELNLMDKVLFMGVVDGKEKEKAFLEADICIVPSYSENFGMVVIEALSYSIPVIVSRSLSWQDIEKVGCGFSVENDPLNLAKAIEIAYQSPLEEMGKKGRVWVENNYSWESIADIYINVMTELINKSK